MNYDPRRFWLLDGFALLSMRIKGSHLDPAMHYEDPPKWGELGHCQQWLHLERGNCLFELCTDTSIREGMPMSQTDQLRMTDSSDAPRKTFLRRVC